EGGAELDAGFAAGGDDLLGFGDGAAERFLAQDVFAGFGAGADLFEVRLHGAADIHGVDAGVQQGIDGIAGEGIGLFGDFFVGGRVGAVNGNQVGIAGGNDAFGNGASASDAAGADDGPF